MRAAFDRCPQLSAVDHRPIPYIRWWLDGDPGTVSTIEHGKSPLGQLLLVPRRTFVPRWFYRENLPSVKPPAGWTRLDQTGSWRIFAAPGCAR